MGRLRLLLMALLAVALLAAVGLVLLPMALLVAAVLALRWTALVATAADLVLCVAVGLTLQPVDPRGGGEGGAPRPGAGTEGVLPYDTMLMAQNTSVFQAPCISYLVCR